MYNTSISLIDKHHQNILNSIDEPKIPEEPKLLKEISIINKELSIKYSNLVNKFNEIIVQAFN